MLRNAAERITDILAANKIVPGEDTALYIYGFHQGFLLLLNILTLCLIGYILGMMKESMAFLLAYIPLRSYAGGFHAKTSLRCYLLSAIVMPCVLLLIKLPFWEFHSAAAVMSAAMLAVVILSPVDSADRRFNTVEKRVFRRRSLIALSILAALSLIFINIGQTNLSICIIMAVTLSALMLIAGKIKNQLGGER